ncbi:GyrI-like small molecule binding protein [Dysgonomonas alginatilytica]|uniref:GyrI-like small molecule binding protein n=1 Tax=Dysgonomonas alginatilytica TaxID=1605892 RepID=A0A2V3PSP4_9BACT|nr:GyrI-like domain-containing protein [Dysgonomonas alginatilytica]PXV65541.1 GyrI-like small molecule binding protein [Dysgonomonas alginatilytica]
MLKIILVVVTVLLAIVLIAYIYYGGLSKVTVKEKIQGGEILVYEEVVGDYAQTGKYTDKVYYELLNNEGIETTKGFGIFYDNPQEVEKSKLRSEVGCIVEGLDSVQIADLAGKYKVRTYPQANYVTAEFPFKGHMSIMIGLMKVYSQIDKYIKEHGINDKGAIMEIYDVPNKKIIYRKEIIQ